MRNLAMSAALMIAFVAISAAASAQDTHHWIDKTRNDVREKWIEKTRNEPPGRNIKDGFGKPLRFIDYPPGPLTPHLREDYPQGFSRHLLDD